jgi:transcriptional regulator with XRE-family HTH domain
MERSDFPALLRATREATGLSMPQLAEKAGVDSSMVSRLEGGHRNPTRDMIGLLCEGLGLDEDDVTAHDLFLAAGFVPAGYRLVMARVVTLERVA